MKIGIVAACPFVVDRGTPLRVLGISKGLADLGHDVTICTYHLGRDIEIKGVDVKRVPRLPFYKKKTAGPAFMKPLVDLFLLKESLSVFKKEAIDFLVGSHFEGSLIAVILKKVLGKKVVYDAHGSLVGEITAFNFLNKNSSFLKPLNSLEKYVVRNSDAVAPVSQQLKEFYQGVASTPVKVVPNGVFRNDFESPEDVREEFDISENKKIIGYAGNLSEYQGIGHLLEAARKLEDFNLHFLIAGGPVREYEKIAYEKGVKDRVTFTDRVSFRKVPDILMTADILVAPRIGKNTTTQQASKLMYYLSAGKPIIATDIPPHDVIKNEENGILIKDDSAEAIKEGVTRLLEDRKLAKKISKNARTESKKFSWKKSAKELLDLYRAI